MFRSILAMVVALAVTPTQAQKLNSNADALWAHIQAENNDPVLIDPEFTELRRDSEESVFLRAKIKSASTDRVSSYWGAPSPQNGRFLPTELQIEPSRGFTARAVRYERPQKVSFASGEPDLALGPYSTRFHFKLRADPDLAVGDYVVRGRLRFQQVSNAAISEPQELQFAIPVHVVEHNAKVIKNPYYPWEMTPGDWVRVIILMPILLPITLLTWDGC